MSENPAGSGIRHIRQRIGELADATAMLPTNIERRIVAVIPHAKVAGDEAATSENLRQAVGRYFSENPGDLVSDSYFITNPEGPGEMFRSGQELEFIKISRYSGTQIPGLPGWRFEKATVSTATLYHILCPLKFGYYGSGGYWSVTTSLSPGFYYWQTDIKGSPSRYTVPVVLIANDSDIEEVSLGNYKRPSGYIPYIYKIADLASLQTLYRRLADGQTGILVGMLTGYGLSFADARRLAALDLPAAQYALVPRYMEIGYDMDDIERCLPLEIPDPDADFAYAREIMEGWDSTATSLKNRFVSNQRLVVMPKVDTSAATNMNHMFSSCTRLSAVPKLDTSGVTDMGDMFAYCYALTSVPLFDASAVTGVNFMFYQCSGLTNVPSLDLPAATSMYSTFSGCEALVNVPPLDTCNARSMSGMFENCKNLQRIEGLDFSSVTTMSNMFKTNKYTNDIVFLKITNLGKSSATTYDLSLLSNWGSGNAPENRQSLIDTLLTDSHDRVADGMPAATIRLYSSTRWRLTPEEIAAITAKGYTITT